MRIAVCDDEPREANLLKELIDSYFGNLYITDVFCCGEELLENRKKYDVFFLDIKLKDIDGLSIAETIRKRDTQAIIIFVTNYEDFYSRAFRVHAFEYLIKPVKKENLFKILEEVYVYKQKDIQNQKICFDSIDGNVRVQIHEILYFEYFDRKIKMVLESGEIKINGTMREIRTRMEKYDFYMTHKAYLVNMRKIRKARRFEITIENGDVIPVAQKKAADFKDRFEKYLYTQV